MHLPFPNSRINFLTSSSLLPTSPTNPSNPFLTSSFPPGPAPALNALSATANRLTPLTTIISNGVVVLPSSSYPETLILSTPPRPNNSPFNSVAYPW